MQSQKLFPSQEKKRENDKHGINFKHRLDLEEALRLLKLAKEQSQSPQGWPQETNCLLSAIIKFKSEEAGDYLITRIFEKCAVNASIELSPILRELEKVYETNSIAAYVLGELYRGVQGHAEKSVLPTFSKEEKAASIRQQKAIHYYEISISQGNDKARMSLSTAFAKGKGCITANEKRWCELNSSWKIMTF